MFVIMSMLCLFTEGLREDWLYQLSHPPTIKYLLTYLLAIVAKIVQFQRENEPKCIRMGKTVLKIVIWEDRSSVL